MDNWKNMEKKASTTDWPEEDESWKNHEVIQIRATDADLNFDSLSEHSKKDKEGEADFSDEGNELQEGNQTSGLSDGMEYLTTCDEEQLDTETSKTDDNSQNEERRLNKWIDTNLIFIANNLPKVLKCHIDLDSDITVHNLVEKANYLASLIQQTNREIRDLAEVRITEKDVKEHEKNIIEALEMRKKHIKKLETLRDTIFCAKKRNIENSDVGKLLKERKSLLIRLYRFAEKRDEESSVHMINRLILDSSRIRGTREYNIWEQEQIYNIVKPTLKGKHVTPDMLKTFEDHIKYGVIFNWRWLKETLMSAIRYSSARAANNDKSSDTDKKRSYPPRYKNTFHLNNKRSIQMNARHNKTNRLPGRKQRLYDYEDSQTWKKGNRLKRPYKESESPSLIKRRR